MVIDGFVQRVTHALRGPGDNVSIIVLFITCHVLTKTGERQQGNTCSDSIQIWFPIAGISLTTRDVIFLPFENPRRFENKVYLVQPTAETDKRSADKRLATRVKPAHLDVPTVVPPLTLVDNT